MRNWQKSVELTVSDQRWRRVRLLLPCIAAICGLTLGGCGGGGSTAGGSGSLDVRPVWPQPGGGSTTTLPAAEQTVRVVFDSDAGLHCCLAINPTTVPIDQASGLRLLVLDQLPSGPATFTMAAFVTDFAPAPNGVTDLCQTDPPGVGAACDATRPASPSFESPAQPTTIVSGTRTQAIDISMVALPFVFDLQPALGDSIASPFPVAFAAADAVTGIDGSSVTVEAFFRSLSKRVPVQLNPCDDKTASPCSQGGQLQVTGFHAVATPVVLPAGPASLRITARNLASPPRELDFSYDFTVLPGDQAAAQTQAAAVSAQSLDSAGDRSDATAPAGSAATVKTTGILPTLTPVPVRTPTGTPAAPHPRRPTPTATATSVPQQTTEGPR